MFQKPEWKPWGIYIVEAVRYGPLADLDHAVKCHDAVARFMLEHPERREELMPDGEINYFRVLHLAETSQSCAQLQLPMKEEKGWVS